MRLYFKQRFFSWFDSYDIYDEAGNVVYTVEGSSPGDTVCTSWMPPEIISARCRSGC